MNEIGIVTNNCNAGGPGTGFYILYLHLSSKENDKSLFFELRWECEKRRYKFLSVVSNKPLGGIILLLGGYAYWGYIIYLRQLDIMGHSSNCHDLQPWFSLNSGDIYLSSRFNSHSRRPVFLKSSWFTGLHLKEHIDIQAFICFGH
jgi:hypothetical protein